MDWQDECVGNGQQDVKEFGLANRLDDALACWYGGRLLSFQFPGPP